MKKRGKGLVWLLLGLSVIVATVFLLRRCHSVPPTTGEHGEGVVAPVPQDVDEEVSESYDLRAGACYMVIVNEDTAFAGITEVQGGKVKGVVYPLSEQSAYVSPVPFTSVSRLFNSHLELNGRTYTFKRSGTLHSHVDGNIHLLFDQEGNIYRFQAIAYHSRPLEMVEDSSYRKAQYPVNIARDIRYGEAKGYWTAHEWDTTKSYVRIALEGVRNTMNMTKLPLKMDIYSPQIDDDVSAHPRPLIMWLHGGAYYVNDKCEESIVEWCKHFAALGYHCASIDYRQGFLPTRDGIERTAYMAVQDAHAAMRYLVHPADRYGIDTNALFVAGASAGSITALNLIFMTERERPASSYGYGAAGRRAKEQALRALNGEKNETHKVRTRGPNRPRIDTTANSTEEESNNLGPIDGSGNTLKATFHIKAVANLWGAVYDVAQLKNSRTNIVSVHGDADLMVPYEKGYPFQDQTKLGKYLVGTLYGSAAIHRKARGLGLRSTLVTLAGKGHAPQLDNNYRLNMPMFNLIKDSITAFFYDELVPQPATIQGDSLDARLYHLASMATDTLEWEAEGGFIVRQSERDVWVVWRNDATNHCLRAAGRYHNGIGFAVQYLPPIFLSLSDNQPQDTLACRTPLKMVSK